MRIGVNGQSVSHWESLSLSRWPGSVWIVERDYLVSARPILFLQQFGVFSKRIAAERWPTKRRLQKSIRVWFLSSAIKRRELSMIQSLTVSTLADRCCHDDAKVNRGGAEQKKSSERAQHLYSLFPSSHECQLSQWNVRFAQLQRNLWIKKSKFVFFFDFIKITMAAERGLGCMELVRHRQFREVQIRACLSFFIFFSLFVTRQQHH